MGKRELVALLILFSRCLVIVERLFLAVPRGCLRFVIVVFPDHTHLLFLIIMDFAKAFDKITHRRLLHKLEYYGIRGSTHKWINSWLSGCTQQIVLDGQASDPVPVLSSVPQGSVLGPVLFLIFINDLLDNIRSPVCLFTDDCVLYKNIHSLQDCLILQELRPHQLRTVGNGLANEI